MADNSATPREARLLLRRIAHVTRPQVTRRSFIKKEADKFGLVLLRLVQLGLALKSTSRKTGTAELRHVSTELGQLDPEVLTSDLFRVGVDQALAAMEASDPAGVAAGFSLVSDFLVGQHRTEAALAFGHTAVFLDQESPLCSWKLARLYRQLGRKETVSWYARAIVLAEQQQVWETVIRCWLGLAWAAFERKKLRSAKGYAGLALRVARDHRLKPLIAEASHYLAVMCFKLGQPAKGFVHARDAVREYGDDRAKIAMLANDVAQLVYSETGQFARALPLFGAALREVTHPYDKLHIMASYARAAGGAGEVAEFKWVIQHMYPLIDDAPEKLGVAEAFKDVARGAISAGLLDEAKRALQVAFDAAARRETEDASEIVPIDDELKALEKSVSKGTSKAHAGEVTSLEHEVIDRIIHRLGSARIDALVKELLNDGRQRNATTSLSIDCDLYDATLVKELVGSLGGTLDADVRTLNGISVYASNIPVSKLALIVEHPATRYVAVPDDYILVD